jgi:hypothetical protein
LDRGALNCVGFFEAMKLILAAVLNNS